MKRRDPTGSGSGQTEQPGSPASPSSRQPSPSANSSSRLPLGARYLSEFAPLFSVGEKMRAVRGLLEEVASTDATILVRGESGVGKDVVARAIHAASPRRDGPFVKVNCAALPAELLESELFGHEKGAFTGAYRRKLGKFEFANRGTICLDEIGELPRALQAKLLHVLQDLQFSRIGGRELIQVDVRVVATTNRNLENAIVQGEFREDLYYRLNVVELWVPPLRERREGIPSLVEFFLARCREQYGRSAEIPPETMALFMEYAWPGNVRELENAIRRLVVVGDVRHVHDEFLSKLRSAIAQSSQRAGPLEASRRVATEDDAMLGLKAIARRAAREAERKALLDVLEQVRWNRAAAARILKVSYKTLLSKLTECGIASRSTRAPLDAEASKAEGSGHGKSVEQSEP